MKKWQLNKYLILTLSLVATYGCSSKPVEKSNHYDTSRITEKQRQHIVTTAKKQIGVSYRPGGSSPKIGFDCSGLAMYSYSQAGIKIQRDSRSQAQQFSSVKNAQVDDIIFFKINGRTVSHSGIYLGNDKMVHAPSSGGKVEIVSINQPYWKKTFYKFGQI